jgi:hypothetical protein
MFLFCNFDEALSFDKVNSKWWCSLESAVKKLRLWLNFLTAQQCNGNECCGNSTPTRLLYSAAGGKVNRQTACTRWTVDNSAPGRWIARSLVYTEQGTTRRLEYFDRFSATSLGKVFSDLWPSEAFEIFSRIELVTKNDLAPRRGYCWGPTSSPKVLQAKTPSAVCYANWDSTKVQAEATIQGASAWQRLETNGSTDLKSKRPFSPW